MSIVEGMDETNKTLYGRIKTLYETRVQDEIFRMMRKSEPDFTNSAKIKKYFLYVVFPILSIDITISLNVTIVNRKKAEPFLTLPFCNK